MSLIDNFPYWVLPEGLSIEGYEYYLRARQLITERGEKGKRKLFLDNPDLQGQRLYLFTPQEETEQLQFVQSQKRERWFISSNQVGKTVAAANDILLSCIGKHPYRQDNPDRRKLGLLTAPPLSKPPLDVWVVSDTDETSREIVQLEIYKFMPEFSEHLKSTNEYTRENGWKNNIISFKNGTVVSFKNIKQGVGAFGGVKRDIVWIDTENPNFRPIYNECQMRTVTKGGSLIVTYVPCHGHDWTFYDVYMKYGEKESLDIFGYGVPISNNIYIDMEKADEIREMFTDSEAKARLGGVYSLPSGMVYDIFNPSIHGIPKENQVLPHMYDGKWYMDIDFGWDHPFAWILRWVDGDGRYCCIDEIKERHLDSEKCAKRIIAKLEKNNLVEWKHGIGETNIRAGICDPAEPGQIRDLYREIKRKLGRGIKLIAAPRLKDINSGVRIVYRLLKSAPWKDGVVLPRWFYWKGGCVELEREMSSYHYKEGGNDEIETVNDDLVSANRYGIIATELSAKRKGVYFSKDEDKESTT